MPGFGSGPFGGDPFGQWNWSRYVLYESIPALYKDADPATGDLLRKYAGGLQYSFDNLRGHIRDMGELRDAIQVRSEYSGSEFIVLGKQVPPTGATEQAGTLGVVETVGIFKSDDRTARFTPDDIGKQIFIRRSNVPVNNQQTYIVTGYVGPKELATDPAIFLDAGPMRWELRSQTTLPEGEVEVEVRGGDAAQVELGWVIEDGTKKFEVASRQMYWQPVTQSRLLNEREADDGVLALRSDGGVPAYTLYSPTYDFQFADVGKQLLVSGAYNPASDGLWEIVAVEPLGPGGANVAIFGRLTAPGEDNNPNGKTDYVYQETADRMVTVEHVYQPLSDLPLEVSYSTANQTRFDITVRLATDVGGAITTLPSDIGTALAADPPFSKYVRAGRAYTGGTETPVGPFSRTAIKGGPLPAQAGKVFWSLRPFARLVLYGPLPLGVIDEEGYDLAVLGWTGAGSLVRVASEPFQAEDEGRLLTIRGSQTGNDGTYTILQVNSSSEVLLDAHLESDFATVTSVLDNGSGALRVVTASAHPFVSGTQVLLAGVVYAGTNPNGAWTVNVVSPTAFDLVGSSSAGFTYVSGGVADSPCYWAKRTAPVVQPATTRLNPQNYEVVAHAEPLLDFLAYDFGLQTDSQQVDERQRAWVRQVSQWTAKKGTAQSVVDVAHLEGFEATIASLYTLPLTSGVFPGVNLYFVSTERFGVSGSLVLNGSDIDYQDPTFTFTSADVGKVLAISGTDNPDNTGYFSILAYIAPDTVRLSPTSIGGSLGTTTIVAPDANNPLLIAALGDVYSDTPYSLPLFDDVDYDRLAQACDVVGLGEDDRPGIDTPSLNIQIIVGNYNAVSTAVSVTPGVCEIVSVSTVGLINTVTVRGDDYEMVIGGNWKLTDSSGTDYYFTASGVAPVANSLSSTTSSYVQPLVGNTVVVPVVSSAALLAGQTVTVRTATGWAGIYTVSFVPSGTSVELLLVTEGDALSGDTVVTGRPVVLGSPVTVNYTDLYSNPQTTTAYPEATYTLTIYGAIPPALGPVAFTYQPIPIFDCTSCPTFRVAVTLTPQKVLSEGSLALDNAFERCVRLLEDALPAHVSPVYSFVLPLQTNSPLLFGTSGSVTVTP